MPGTSRRGFASMDPLKQKEIASKGGKAAHLKGTAHQFTPEEARIAGSKGGKAARQRRQMVLITNNAPVSAPNVTSPFLS